MRGGHALFHRKASPHASARRGLAALSISLDGILDQAVAVQLDVVRSAGRGHGLPYDPLCLADRLHGSFKTSLSLYQTKSRTSQSFTVDHAFPSSSGSGDILGHMGWCNSQY